MCLDMLRSLPIDDIGVGLENRGELLQFLSDYRIVCCLKKASEYHKWILKVSAMAVSTTKVGVISI